MRWSWKNGLMAGCCLLLAAVHPAWAGERITLSVPDTLDLAERMKLSIHPNVQWAIDEDADYGAGGAAEVSTPNRACCGPKFLEAAAFARVMTGDMSESDTEALAIEGYANAIAEPGLFFVPALGPIDEPWANIFGQGRLLLAWLALYERDQDPRYLELMKRVVAGLSQIAIEKNDYAYYPTETINNAYYIFAWRKSGWKQTAEPQAFHAMHEGQARDLSDRDGHQFDARMGIPAYIGTVLRPLPRYYELTGDKTTLDLAGKLVRFIMRPEMWQAYGMPVEITNPAQYSGHVHGHLIALRGILDYARVTGDRTLMEFVRSGYDFTRSLGIPQVGWYPEWTNNNVAEGCEIADMIALGIRLSDLGLGDYWEDVDRTVRNQLAENQQLTDDPAMRGKFAAGSSVTSKDPQDGACCCTPNCTQALYYAWEGITRFKDGLAVVNLALNRATPWLDVISSLPYEGKIILHNKQAREVLVRIPAWVDRAAVRCTVNGAAAQPVWAGSSLLFTGLAPGDIVIEFPMKEYELQVQPMQAQSDIGASIGIAYQFIFRGNTVVDVSPRREEPGRLPTYQRAAMRASTAPMIEREFFVQDKLIAW